MGITMINYNYILGQTPLDEEEKRDLIPSLITRTDLDNWEQENILQARKWLMQKTTIARNNLFTQVFLLKLHKQMFGHVWKWAGKFRKTNKNIGVEFYQIPLELQILLKDTEYWLENKSYDYSDIAIIFHHRLVKIHLFANGNGRHARLVADAIIAKYNHPNLSWGGTYNLNKPDEIRKNYITALRNADAGNYDALIKFAK